jgi:hypothetical protein
VEPPLANDAIRYDDVGGTYQGQAAICHRHWLHWSRRIRLLVQVSIIVFLLHGYIGSAIVMLKRTAVISFAIALFDATLKAILIWGFKVPLYSFGGAHVGDVQGDMLWSKWGFWMAHALIFASAYLAMLVLPFTKWRDLLPSKDTFHYYVRILFTVNVVRYSSSFTPAMAELEVSCAVPGH